MKYLLTFLLGICVAMLINSIKPDNSLPELTPIQTSTITWSQDMEKANEITDNVKGLAGFNLEDGVCTVYAPIPETEEDLYILGHEVFHCFVGEFHE